MPSIYIKKYPDGRRIDRLCEVCGEAFSVPRRSIARGQGRFCSRSCQGAARRRRVEVTCRTCGQPFEVRVCEGETLYCSWECRWLGMRGEAHPGFKGHPDYRGWDWDEARAAARERDGDRCTRCRADTGLIVHHVVPWEESHDNSLENLATLCRPCHQRVHRRKRSGERRAFPPVFHGTSASGVLGGLLGAGGEGLGDRNPPGNSV